MTTKRRIWFWIAAGLSALNLAGAGYALAGAEQAHTGVHVLLALAFGWWARRLSSRPDRTELPADLEALQIEVNRMRQELSEAHERIDFAERLLAQGPEPRRASQPRQNP